MEGWRPVEELIQWGFAHAPVVMANEAHPMGWHFRAMSGTDPFVIDQTVSVRSPKRAARRDSR